MYAWSQAVLEQCVRALAGLVCHPALAQAAAAEGIELWAEEKLQAAARAVIEKLFLSHDKRSIGAPAALKVRQLFLYQTLTVSKETLMSAENTECPAASFTMSAAEGHHPRLFVH